MSTVKRNVAANLAGSIWSALLTVVVLPIYLRLLGAELFGLVGLYTTLQMLFLLLDLGLGTTANREMARMNVDGEAGARARPLLKTLEVVYWGGALLILVIVTSASPLIASHWLRPTLVSRTTVVHALMAMGMILALQFPYGLYSGALLGLQRHVQLNLWLIVSTSMRLLLPLPALWFYGPDLTVFFLIQAMAMLIQTLGARLMLNRAVPKILTIGAVDFAELRRVRRFATGVTAMTVLGVVAIQMDRLIMSRFASLQELAYYSVAAAAATGLGMISVPIHVAAFPRFSQLVAAGRRADVEALYHHATQLLAALLFPLAAIIAVFSRELLAIWTGNPLIAEHVAIPLAFLTIAISASSLGYVAQALQLADGQTRFAATLNGVGVLLLIPAMSLAARNHGGAGVALISAIWNLVALCATITFVHRRLLQGGGLRWFFRDVAPPLSVSLVAASAGRYLFHGLHGFAAIGPIVLSGVLALLGSVAVVPATRAWLAQIRSPRS